VAITLKGILGAVAPILASAIPGPFGGMARDAIGKLLGKQVTSQEEIEKILATASPETLLALKKLDTEFAAQMKSLDVDLEKVAAEDRGSARGMQIATKAKTPAVLATVIVVGWILLMAFLMHSDIPQANREIIIQAVGTMGGALMMVVSFYYGTSAGSAKKDETIAKLSE
jgi:hypothetical protein